MPKISMHQAVLVGLITATVCLIASVSGAASWRSRIRPHNAKPDPVKSEGEILYPKSQYCPDRANDWGIPYRYYKPTRKCYLVGERGPCNELMEFTLQDENFGFCDCDQSLRCGRPLIYWPSKKRCYFVNDQGPCSEGKWFVFGFDNRPICRKNNCLSKSTLATSSTGLFGNSFWFEKSGTCYKTGSQGYCKDNEVLVNKWNDYRPTCSLVDTPKCGGNGFIPQMECLPGMKMDYFDKCVEQLVRNRTREAEIVAIEEAKRKVVTPAYNPYQERYPEDEREIPVYSLHLN